MYPQPHITRTVSIHFEAMATPIHRSAIPGSCCVTCHLKSEAALHICTSSPLRRSTLRECKQLFEKLT